MRYWFLSLFAVLAVTVSIGGFLNIRWMFARLKAQDSEDEPYEEGYESFICYVEKTG